MPWVLARLSALAGVAFKTLGWASAWDKFSMLGLADPAAVDWNLNPFAGVAVDLHFGGGQAESSMPWES